MNYVGPGGFMNIANEARTIIFAGSWTAGGRYGIQNGRLVVKKHGKPKFVDRLMEKTFNAKNALHNGRKVFYVTTVGTFELTEQGIKLVQVVPGADIERDILQVSGAEIIIPEDLSALPLVPDEIVTGQNFQLKWQ